MPERLQMCRRAIRLVQNANEKKLMLSALANICDPEVLTIVEPFLQSEEVRAEAATAAIRIAAAITQTHPHKAKAAMNRLLVVLRDENLRKQAKEIIRQIDQPKGDMR